MSTNRGILMPMTTSTFQRARTEEQRQLRHAAIRSTTVQMLDEMRVADVTLGEIGRRVGLAKSNVLRYVGSREALLFDLLDHEWAAWLADLDARLTATPDDVDTVVEALVTSLGDHPVFCDLLAAQGVVLEHNVSPDVAAHYKRTSLDHVAHLARLLARALPALDETVARQLAIAASTAISATWTSCRPSAAMTQAYAADADLRAMAMSFAPTLRFHLAALVTGALAQKH